MASQIAIRRVASSDLAAIDSFYAGLSADSCRSRFLGSARVVASSMTRSFCTLDHLHDEGFVAVVDDHAESARVVGHLCLTDLGSDSLELGIVVADQYQGHGIGRRLVSAGLTWAREHGYGSICATCFADNSRLLRLLRATEPGVKVCACSTGTVDVVAPIEPRERRRTPVGRAA